MLSSSGNPGWDHSRVATWQPEIRKLVSAMSMFEASTHLPARPSVLRQGNPIGEGKEKVPTEDGCIRADDYHQTPACYKQAVSSCCVTDTILVFVEQDDAERQDGGYKGYK